MKKRTLEEQIKEAIQLVDELNNLDFTKPEEDLVFMDNLARLDSLEKELDGVPKIIAPKTIKYLQ